MDNLNRNDVLLVFTYAIAGLGHLRVTDALYDGLPEGVGSVPMGADDTNITFWHRLMSVNPIVRRMMEWFQQEKQEQWFDRFYIWTLRRTTKHLYQQMEHLIIQQWHEKKIMVVVSTHFGLAHQIAKIRSRLEAKFKIKIILVVQVTDATSMKIWYVEGADLISVPSEEDRRELVNYATKRGLKKAKVVVLPYPLDKAFVRKLSGEEYNLRLKQYDGDNDCKIKVAIPISGAAVGMGYYEKITSRLARISDRFHFYIVVRRNIHTLAFIQKMKARNYITVIDESTDKGAVDAYEKLYEQEVIAFEIVKPSEQTFKALIKPNQRGGVILLLTEAVGKQEQDNLNFLMGHKLLLNYSVEHQLPTEKVSAWRALKLTHDPERDVALINQSIRMGIFRKMAEYSTRHVENDPELASNGVQQFWDKVDGLVEKEGVRRSA